MESVYPTDVSDSITLLSARIDSLIEQFSQNAPGKVSQDSTDEGSKTDANSSEILDNLNNIKMMLNDIKMSVSDDSTFDTIAKYEQSIASSNYVKSLTKSINSLTSQLDHYILREQSNERSLTNVSESLYALNVANAEMRNMAKVSTVSSIAAGVIALIK